MTITDQVILMSKAEFWLICAGLGALSVSCFFWAFRLFHKGRTIENTPTAKIRSAQQGYVELTGKAQAIEGRLVVAPLTGTRCCWYSYRIDKRANKGWRRVDGGVSETLFLISDDTGECVIDPKGAEVHARGRKLWYGHSREASAFQSSKPAATESSILSLTRLLMTPVGPGGRFRYSEACIHVGDDLYAAGLFKSFDDIDHNETRREMTLEILKSWKEDQPSLLDRFDTNGDRRIDIDEWELAREEAKRIAGERQRAQELSRHLHIMSKPGSLRRPFLLSTLSESRMIRNYRLRAGLAITAFFLSGGTTIWMLGQRLG